MFYIGISRGQKYTSDEINGVYEDLLDSVRSDGVSEDLVLMYVGALLEAARAEIGIYGAGDSPIILDAATDVVELLLQIDKTIDLIKRARDGRVELYPGVGSEDIVFISDSKTVNIFRIPWEICRIKDYPFQSIDQEYQLCRIVVNREQLTGCLQDFRKKIANYVIEIDERFGSFDPIFRWSTSSF